VWPGNYIMGTKCPRKDSNIQNPGPCGGIFLVRMRKTTYIVYMFVKKVVKGIEYIV